MGDTQLECVNGGATVSVEQEHVGSIDVVNGEDKYEILIRRHDHRLQPVTISEVVRLASGEPLRLPKHLVK